MPNTGRRITHRRAGDNSRPITNSSITTPSSEIASVLSTFLTSLKPYGPIAAPATR